MAFKSTSELSREEPENRIDKSNKYIQRLKKMKSESPSEMGRKGFDNQIQAEEENIELYQHHLNQKP